MVAVHRATADEPWQVYADQTVNAGSLTNGTGSIDLQPLRKGQYAFAKISGAIGLPEKEGGAFILFPVPTDDRLTARFDAPLSQLALLDVIAADGRLMMRSTLGAGNSTAALDVSSVPSGSYVLRASTVQGDVLGARAFSIAR
ncbi:MAG: T9SS type A sorting domain-containing protein [Flavobacteriales bacterium]|nr:T9SS type A sorting domain-containing protein [Flavobacteriales bacterium]